jgi:deoxyadenosine/deoxycytidine kinase
MKYIEVVGIMGTGKTSLARLFNEKAGFDIVIEREQDLDRLFFLKEYLSEPEKYAFEGALNFLGFHVNRIRESLSKLPEDATVLVDTAILNQYAYAKGAVSGEELEAISRIVELTYRRLPPVSLRIVTTLPPEVHAERIRRRGRAFEEGVSLEYLEKSQHLLDEAVAKFGGATPTLKLDASKLDWANDERGKREVLNLARAKLGL